MTAVTSTPTKKAGLLINRSFALLWGGGVVSRFGDYIFDTTLVLWIVTVIARGQSWAPLAVSGVLIAASVPVFAIGPIAGVFADRWDKRQTMLRMDAIRAALVALLLLVTGVVPLALLVGGRFSVLWQLGAMYAVVFLASTCGQFFNPASLALVGDIVDEPYRARATGLMQMMSSLAMIVGPPLATVLFFAVGVQWAILFNALSFVVSWLALLLIRAPKATRSIEAGEEGNFLREFSEGIRFYVGNQVLMSILITGVLVMFFEGSANALDVFFVTRNLRAPVNFYGFLATASGAGLTLGAALAAAFAQRVGVARTFWLSFLLSAALIVVYARLTSFIPAIVVLFLSGVFVGAVNVAVMPLALHVTPKELIGRVAAVVTPVMTLASILSVAVAGWLVSGVLRGLHATLLGVVFGPIDTIFTVTGVLAVIGGLYAMVNLRKVKLQGE